MKLGVMTILSDNATLEKTFEYLSSLGINVVELGFGGYSGKGHIKPGEFLDEQNEVDQLKELLKTYNLKISALNILGNGVHPNENLASRFNTNLINVFKIAEILGVDTVNTFSGCPGKGRDSKFPNWIFSEAEDLEPVKEYQWNDVLIPYWQDKAKVANSYGVNKIALNMHPGFNVYDADSLLKLRSEVGEAIGVNFDPSNLYWQGINTVEAIKELKDAIYNFVAKDTKIDFIRKNVNGVLPKGNYSIITNRDYTFKTIQYGYDCALYEEMISALAEIKYNGVISIQLEDILTPPNEGLEKVINFFKETVSFKLNK